MAWQRIRGHDRLIEGFQRVVQRGRLAHAYLFTGPAGIGKRLFANELARALLCEKPATPLQACDHCTSCQLVDAGTHPDFRAAGKPEDALEFPIELMRELCNSFSLKSARGRGKIILIDDVDDFNEESANCFLKTLEEPPPRAVLILVGTTPERQLPTIVSRCQVVRFAPLSPDRLREVLQQHDIRDPLLLDRLTHLSGGSPGLALALADPELWEFRNRLLAGLLARPIDPVALATLWNEYVEQAGKESAPRRNRAKLVLRLLIDWLADALELTVGGRSRRASSGDQAALHSLAQRSDPERLLELLERCLEADRQIDRRVQLVLVLEALLDSLTQRLAV
jgi:DNA polymerase-3 subunit delta'